uniref:Kinesin-like protein n=1 Tax=Photinus pyralis TaxID=7054 RepID=A0A1Y1MBY0_PHOPY
MSEPTIENVRVVVRVCPAIKKEDSETVLMIEPRENILTLSKPQMARESKTFQFNHIFTPACTQLNLYQKAAQPIIEQFFNGYNGTIFAYGQTGSGKTHTMSGNQYVDELKGIIPNTFSHIFSKIAKDSGEKSFVVTATHIEIYNEEIRDLLSSNPNQKLELRECVDTGVYVKGVMSYTVDCVESINKLIEISSANRKTRATLMNKFSSRSHAIFTVTIETKDNLSSKVTFAKLNLVDLAGSERLKRSQVTGHGFKEAIHINQSLFVLSNVISALVEQNSSHIPYRQSKLTRLLQDSLGGNSKTVMIATISPCNADYEETLNTLRYASRTKLIKNSVRLNIQTNAGLIENLENEIQHLQSKLVLIVEEQKVKKRPCKPDMEIFDLEQVKNELNSRISALQNKILIGGRTIQEQEFLLESVSDEIQKLDKSQQELQDTLGEKQNERIGLEGQYGSLQEEDKELGKGIERMRSQLNALRVKRDEQRQEHQAELTQLFENNSVVTSELQRSNRLIEFAIPNALLAKINCNVTFNDETGDYELKGVAHVGNNIKSKRRFRKHIPQQSLMATLLNQRKNMARRRKIATTQKLTHNQYLQYPQAYFFDEEDS